MKGLYFSFYKKYEFGSQAIRDPLVVWGRRWSKVLGVWDRSQFRESEESGGDVAAGACMTWFFKSLHWRGKCLPWHSDETDMPCLPQRRSYRADAVLGTGFVADCAFLEVPHSSCPSFCHRADLTPIVWTWALSLKAVWLPTVSVPGDTAQSASKHIRNLIILKPPWWKGCAERPHGEGHWGHLAHLSFSWGFWHLDPGTSPCCCLKPWPSDFVNKTHKWLCHIKLWCQLLPSRRTRVDSWPENEGKAPRVEASAAAVPGRWLAWTGPGKQSCMAPLLSPDLARCKYKDIAGFIPCSPRGRLWWWALLCGINCKVVCKMLNWRSLLD